MKEEWIFIKINDILIREIKIGTGKELLWISYECLKARVHRH